MIKYHILKNVSLSIFTDKKSCVIVRAQQTGELILQLLQYIVKHSSVSWSINMFYGATVGSSAAYENNYNNLIMKQYDFTNGCKKVNEFKSIYLVLLSIIFTLHYISNASSFYWFMILSVLLN